jgi:hypothetical protein
MAKIYGVEIKGVKPLRGMEYAGFSGNIYMDNKKVGEVIDDGDGGGMQIDIEENKIAEFNKRSDTFLKTLSQKVSDLMKNDNGVMLLSKIQELNEIEKEFKKQTKSFGDKKVSFVVVYNTMIEDFNDPEFNGYWFMCPVGWFMCPVGNEEKRAQELRDQKNWKIDNYKVFVTLADFNIPIIT